MDMTQQYFAIHGDNIIECERTIHLVSLALTGEYSTMRGPFGSPTNPSFEFVIDGGTRSLTFVFFPGFGRWNVDIRHMIRDRGGPIREAPDIILSEVTSGNERPLMAMEYSGALPAGNQAWQRNGRAYSLGSARIPYLYVAEVGGYELDQNRNRKARRLPNPAVLFSYLSYTILLDTPVLPALLPNPEIDSETRAFYASIMGEEELLKFIRKSLLDEDFQRVTGALQKKALTFAKLLSKGGSPGLTLTPEQWTEAYQALEEGSRNALISYLLKKTSLNWSKTAYIKSLTTSAKELMKLASEVSIGLTSSRLPMCLIPPENRQFFAQEIARLYPDIDSDFLDWLRGEEPLIICWVMGFKPRGDDARPDRGLPPFTRMLVGPDVDMLTVVYGPAKPEHWSLLLENPQNLASQNGLWEAIMVASDAILADSATDNVTTHGFLQTHWEQEANSARITPTLVEPSPIHISEHDVDTVIHLVFAHLGVPRVFEGMCNPPGGDWSGLSLQTIDRRKELRWLSLRRVSGSNAKRPDHVLQLFGIGKVPIIFAIESKEKPSAIERKIGPRLSSDVADLLNSSASIERENNADATWQHSNLSLERRDFRLATATAFLLRGNTDVEGTRLRAEVDLHIGLRFSADASHCEISLFPDSRIGLEISDFIAGLPLRDIGLSTHICQ
ncbi:MAG: hypothetical protein OXG26_13560 [Caldilineaceae bacterium]|nr:hypothetical protein [Caldilineaceae bacterium]